MPQKSPFSAGIQYTASRIQCQTVFHAGGRQAPRIARGMEGVQMGQMYGFALVVLVLLWLDFDEGLAPVAKVPGGERDVGGDHAHR